MNHDAPSEWIVRFAHLLRAGARVLDLASGAGRHARFLAARGCEVLAVDRSAALLGPLADVPGITTQCVDLESGPWPLHDQRFDAIVVTNYLHRPVLPHLFAALAADGVLLYETFALGNGAFGKPSNPDFLLAPGELAASVAAVLTVVAFEQGEVRSASRRAVVQRLAAVGRARLWPPLLGPGDTMPSTLA
ncbi:MAG: class I SAM-dependent methyltransferase [Casimicrobiaceae bacterium]